MSRTSKLVLAGSALLLIDWLFFNLIMTSNRLTAPGIIAFVFFLPSVYIVWTIFWILRIPNEISYMPYVFVVQYLLMIAVAVLIIFRKMITFRFIFLLPPLYIVCIAFLVFRIPNQATYMPYVLLIVAVAGLIAFRKLIGFRK